MKKDILFTHDTCGQEISLRLDGTLSKNLKANDFKCTGCNQSLDIDDCTEVKAPSKKKAPESEE
jgi:hypothetical protein